jgi:hypothetical protein
MWGETGIEVKKIIPTFKNFYDIKAVRRLIQYDHDRNLKAGRGFSRQMSGCVMSESGQDDGFARNEIRKMKGGRGFV